MRIYSPHSSSSRLVPYPSVVARSYIQRPGAAKRIRGTLLLETRIQAEANHPGQAALLKASADLYASWEAEIGGPSAVTHVGALMPAGAADVASLEREVAIMQAAGHDVRLVGPDEVAALAPAWYRDDIAAAAYSPGSGYIDPPMVTRALMNRARWGRVSIRGPRCRP